MPFCLVIVSGNIVIYQ